MTQDAKTKALHNSALTAIRSEARIGRISSRLHFDIDADGTATIEAEVDNVAIKRLALERLAATKGVGAVIDRLRVKPAQGDERRRHPGSSAQGLLRRAVLLRARPEASARAVSSSSCADAFEAARGAIETEVKDGVVILNGRVPSLAAKRLAGVIAWWVPGARDVINGIAVDPPEEDAPIAIEEAVRIALDKDPFVDAGQVRVGVRHRTVRLTGGRALARSARRRRMGRLGLRPASMMWSMSWK